MLVWLLSSHHLLAQSVSYDCPAVVGADVLQVSSTNQIVEVVFPVSVSNSDSKLELSEIKIDVFWNRNAVPVIDYSPRTQLHSAYEGSISVEKKSETSFGVNASVSSDYLDFATPKLDADVARKNSQSRKYKEIPQQELLIASGTAKRGTGAFFTFKHSRIQTLEGDRELAMTFDVPATWRAGILQVTIQAMGSKRKFAGFREDFEFTRTFMLPVYIDADDEARNHAYQFARTEQRLRHDWARFQQQIDSPTQFERLFSNQQNDVPPLWAHQLIQGDSEKQLKRFERRRPAQIASTANAFVRARRDLLAISR